MAELNDHDDVPRNHKLTQGHRHKVCKCNMQLVDQILWVFFWNFNGCLGVLDDGWMDLSAKVKVTGGFNAHKRNVP